VAQVKKKTIICDVFCGYSTESGNARFDQTLMRDIVAYFKCGHVKHAHAATHRGRPIPIGDNATVAQPSQYDKERMERLEGIRTAEQEEEEAEKALREEQSGVAAAATDADADATADELVAAQGPGKQVRKRKHDADGDDETADTDASADDDDEPAAAQGQGKKVRKRVRKQRATAGKKKAKLGAAAEYEQCETVKIKVPEGATPGTELTVTTPDGQVAKVTVPEDAQVGQLIEVELRIDVGLGTDRRGKLPYMRLLIKWTDGCGVQVYQLSLNCSPATVVSH
jgi:hypothetical protein